MLVGLLGYSGQPIQPHSHGEERKRYRYYVCHAAAKDSDRQSKPIRLPAYDIEQVSLRETSPRIGKRGNKGLAVLGDHPEFTQQLFMAAKNKQRSGQRPLLAIRDFVRK